MFSLIGCPDWLGFVRAKIIELVDVGSLGVLILINACYFSFAHDRCICSWQNFIIRFFVVYILTLRKLELPFYIILDFRDYSEFRSYSYQSVVIKVLISISSLKFMECEMSILLLISNCVYKLITRRSLYLQDNVLLVLRQHCRGD